MELYSLTFQILSENIWQRLSFLLPAVNIYLSKTEMRRDLKVLLHNIFHIISTKIEHRLMVSTRIFTFTEKNLVEY